MMGLVFVTRTCEHVDLSRAQRDKIEEIKRVPTEVELKNSIKACEDIKNSLDTKNNNRSPPVKILNSRVKGPILMLFLKKRNESLKKKANKILKVFTPLQQAKAFLFMATQQESGSAFNPHVIVLEIVKACRDKLKLNKKQANFLNKMEEVRTRMINPSLFLFFSQILERRERTRSVSDELEIIYLWSQSWC